jgi:prepilin signal peptidase PulO-like enzyme (type II secretory pathway)
VVQPDLRPLVFATVAIFVSLVTEVRTGKILNAVTLPALLLTLALKTVMFGLGAAFGTGLASSLLGAVVYPALAIFVFRLLRGRGLGMGAVKLMAVLGAGVGFRPALVCAAVTVLVAVAYALYALWGTRDEKKPKVMGSPLVAAAWLFAIPIAAWLGW